MIYASVISLAIAVEMALGEIYLFRLFFVFPVNLWLRVGISATILATVITSFIWNVCWWGAGVNILSKDFFIDIGGIEDFVD